MSVTTYPDCTTCCGAAVVDTPCCDVDIPTVLTVTVTNKTGTCTCLPDSFTITYNVSSQKWESGPLCGAQQFALSCAGSTAADFVAETVGAGLSDGYALNVGTASCDPFNLDYLATLNVMCLGTATLTVTE